MNGGRTISQKETRQVKSRERELIQQFPEVWAEDNPPTPGRGGWGELAKKQQVLVVIELKPGTVTSALTLGLPDPAKPFTLYMTEKDKMAMSVVPGYGDMGHTHGLSLKTAGQCCHWVAVMLMGSYLTGSGGNQADFGTRFDRKSPA